MQLLIELGRSTSVLFNQSSHRQNVIQHIPTFVRYLSLNVISRLPLPSDYEKAKKVFNSKNLQLSTTLNLADRKIEEILAPPRPSVLEQGELVCQQLESEVPELGVGKAQQNALKHEEDLTAVAGSFHLSRMEELLKRRLFFHNSFANYDGFTGRFDFGPMACVIKDNLLEAWTKFFPLKEQMLKIQCSFLTPESVLHSPGYVGSRSDLVVTDEKSGENYHLKHLIKLHLEKVKADKNTKAETRLECEDIAINLNGMTKEEMGAVLRRFEMKAPISGNDLSEPSSVTLMFSVFIYQTGNKFGHLSPDLAQGIFVNFNRLHEFNDSKMPLAAAQTGICFRNEISPRTGLIRGREFTMAVFDHFSDPSDKSHPEFDQVRDVRVLLYSACNQVNGKAAEFKTIGEAVADGSIANETLAYFMARIQMFMVEIGVDPMKLRFRQHTGNEMAYYACDSWDAECLTSYGWVEGVSCVDSSDYDLSRHTKDPDVSLVATRRLPEPKMIDVVRLELQKDPVDKAFKNESKDVMEHLAKMDAKAVEAAEESLKANGEFHLELNGSSYRLTPDMVQVNRRQETFHVEEFVPNVTEVSFDIDRIIYAIFEHNFRVRSDDDRKTFFSLPPIIAPLKCWILPLSSDPEFTPIVRQILRDLSQVGVSHKKYDFSGFIGQHQTLTDEIAIPFGITIDVDSLKEPYSATLRERDSTHQVRIPVNEIAGVVHDLSYGKILWTEVEHKYTKHEQQDTGTE